MSILPTTSFGEMKAPARKDFADECDGLEGRAGLEVERMDRLEVDGVEVRLEGVILFWELSVKGSSGSSAK